ncbi:preprotein translocase subunit SecG [bacterium]|nr:preprotein translocase subunit SecG [bacterium]
MKRRKILFIFTWTTQIISALLLIILILLHSPKGDGIAGIGNAAQVFSSQKSAEKGLNKLTYIVAGIFTICIFLLGFGIVK